MNYKNYLIIFSVLSSLFIAYYLNVALLMEPYTGSQTRQGGFLESDYGWNGKLETFNAKLFFKLEEYKHKSKRNYVVVVGDSFSRSPKISWINHLVYNYNIDVIFKDIDHVNIQVLLDKTVNTDNPPLFIIFESAEFDFSRRLIRLNKQLNNSNSKIVFLPTDSSLKTFKEVEIITPVHIPRMKKITFKEQLSLAGDYIYKNIVLQYLIRPTVLSVDIDCDHCFSSKIEDKMLIFSSHLNNKNTNIKRAYNAAKNIQNIIQLNKKTKVLLMAFPNKINVYKIFTKNISSSSVYETKLNKPEMGFVDLLSPFRTAVYEKTTDVYLPNDHHTGAAGSKLASEIFAKIMMLNPR